VKAGQCYSIYGFSVTVTVNITVFEVFQLLLQLIPGAAQAMP